MMSPLNYDNLIARIEMLEEKLNKQPQQADRSKTMNMNLAVSRLRYAKLMMYEAKKFSLAPKR